MLHAALAGIVGVSALCGAAGTSVLVDVADPRDRDRAPWASFRLGGDRRALATSSQAERLPASAPEPLERAVS